ncbi:uncharacterized protein EKO05_0004983 [Ascochyta rabiei]|uniref:Uncharacterized protein n=1 Tax=Didymella rabiei TaxID=5454 RepID=A0A163KIA6_DIDRA|nr:uncharacterized protein EKO05_0004983 [Ascochyta rabiei]KZM27019.1 hypothetical protein ST47_g1825 [Ascochyta rabiei]UPX14503.1 hypothetical protein EKO05_0004983 [Ascochyta rabiei]
MHRTPSPPRRVHTPPAPLHGDSWEPFSPRRSSRVAAQRGLHLEQTDPARTPRTRRDVTPTASSRKSIARTSHLTLSPPSSPTSPPKHRTPRSTRRSLFPAADALDSDSDHPPLTSGRRFLASMAPGMLPTPAKTPRKRALHSEEALQPTARVLFPSRPATIDEVTPRKARRTIKNAYSLESFEQGRVSSEKIEIFTDSKERVPTADEDEENPFVTKKRKGKAKARATPQKTRRANARTVEMEEAVDREEGMVYLFRGRKVFRKFHDGPPSDAPTEEDVQASGDDLQLLRQAGHEARRPLTRSSIKPKLLFQEEIKQKKLENGEVSDEEEDEEAPTDIEAHIATPSRKKGKTVMHIAASLQEATPPPTVRKPKREISFDSWMRVKSSHSSGSSSRGAKRSGSPLVREVDKKARSEHSASSLSTDSI